VLQLWSGLGYYARGRNLHRAAQQIVARGAFPKSALEIAELPGVGRSTAAAIAVFAFGERAAILDGNAKRVLARYLGTDEDLWTHAERLLPRKKIETYTQALMDLGASLCTRVPVCGQCPVKDDCVASKTGRVDELPARRRKKALPLRKTTWYVYLHDGSVLLERRPAPGIWGGLWCFPETKVLEARTLRELPLIEHGFTHFRLNIRPVLCEAREATAGAWFKLPAACEAAVPAPVRTLLQALRAAAPGAPARRRARAAPASPRAAAAAVRQGGR
jgi:A/G-specific adenine glycosylase